MSAKLLNKLTDEYGYYIELNGGRSRVTNITHCATHKYPPPPLLMPGSTIVEISSAELGKHFRSAGSEDLPEGLVGPDDQLVCKKCHDAWQLRARKEIEDPDAAGV